jgi:cytochrome c-type biogenesis protein CcmH
VRQDIVNISRFLKHDVTRHLPDASPEQIAAGGGTVQDSGAPADTAALKTALAQDPTDYAAWILLARTPAMAGEADAALIALQRGRSRFRAAPFVLGKFDAAARELGLDLLDDGRAVAGPTAADIAAASQLSQDDQDDMIDGMVAGLAAKLADTPDDPDDWIMLVRSYASLGRMDAAREAHDTAIRHNAGNAAIAARIRSNAGQSISVD